MWEFHFETLNQSLTSCFRMQILFANSHPVVKEDVDNLKGKNTRNKTKYDLNWEEEPEQKHPKWLKKHWPMMQELQVDFSVKTEYCSGP